MAASGGYYLASAGDHIFADQSAIVGSIGVVEPAIRVAVATHDRHRQEWLQAFAHTDRACARSAATRARSSSAEAPHQYSPAGAAAATRNVRRNGGDARAAVGT